MRFSRKSKKALMPASQGGAVSTDITLSTGDKIFVRSMLGSMVVIPFGFTALIDFDYLSRMLLNPGDFVAGPWLGFLASSLMGIAFSQGYLEDARGDAIVSKLGDRNVTKSKVSKAIKASKKEPILVSSFNIREGVEVNINSWREIPKKTIPLEESTHTVNQYLIKGEKGYRIEQEVIANQETIWDLSANALVEVYNVQEKTAMKELTHE